jgi:hypothetical protein
MRALHHPGMRADQVGAWRDGYGLAWERADAHGVIGLFTEDATYRPHPLRPCMPGHDGIRGVLGAGGTRPGQRPGPVRRADRRVGAPSSSSRSARQPPQGDAHGHARRWPSPARGRRGAGLPSKGECAVPGRAPASHERGTAMGGDGGGRRSTAVAWRETAPGGLPLTDQAEEEHQLQRQAGDCPDSTSHRRAGRLVCAQRPPTEFQDRTLRPCTAGTCCTSDEERR